MARAYEPNWYRISVPILGVSVPRLVRSYLMWEWCSQQVIRTVTIIVFLSLHQSSTLNCCDLGPDCTRVHSLLGKPSTLYASL